MNNYWHNAAPWSLAKSPNRPTSEVLAELTRIAAFVDKSQQVCILGSTIEFRNLLHQLGFKRITVIDASKDFYMWTCLHVRDYHLEHFVHGNWLQSLTSYSQAFALVLSDFTLGNLDYSKQGILQQLIYESLLSGGIYFDRILRFETKGTPLDVLDEIYKELPITPISINLFNSDYLFSSELVTDLGIVNLAKISASLKLRFSKVSNLSNYLRKVELLTPFHLKWYYGKMWGEIQPTYLAPIYSEISIVSTRDFGGHATIFVRTKR